MDPYRQHAARAGRLHARPQPCPTGEAPIGLHTLGLGAGRDGLVYVPAGYRPERPAALVLMLHGAGGNARGGLDPLRTLADDASLVLVAPDSRGRTWDLLLGGYGDDVAFIDRVLEWAFDHLAIDPGRVAVEGFSDGASYALSIGMTNGDLFTHVMAFSPGFAAPEAQEGSPRLFISHGVHDRVLPIEACSRRLRRMLERAGYDLLYREFDGPHTVPPEIVREALAWFAPERV